MSSRLFGRDLIRYQSDVTNLYSILCCSSKTITRTQDVVNKLIFDRNLPIRDDFVCRFTKELVMTSHCFDSNTRESGNCDLR